MRKTLYALLLVSLMVIASEIPKALPEGFLEELTIFTEMKDDDFVAMMEFARRSPVGTGASIKNERDNEEGQSEY